MRWCLFVVVCVDLPGVDPFVCFLACIGGVCILLLFFVLIVVYGLAYGR